MSFPSKDSDFPQLCLITRGIGVGIEDERLAGDFVGTIQLAPTPDTTKLSYHVPWKRLQKDLPRINTTGYKVTYRPRHNPLKTCLLISNMDKKKIVINCHVCLEVTSLATNFEARHFVAKTWPPHLFNSVSATVSPSFISEHIKVWD